jgi:hypothetical protein
VVGAISTEIRPKFIGDSSLYVDMELLWDDSKEPEPLRPRLAGLIHSWGSCPNK